jgi:hypothetical protein
VVFSAGDNLGICFLSVSSDLKRLEGVCERLYCGFRQLPPRLEVKMEEVRLENERKKRNFLRALDIGLQVSVQLGYPLSLKYTLLKYILSH